MSTLSLLPTRKKQKLSSKASFDDLPSNVLGTIFSFLQDDGASQQQNRNILQTVGKPVGGWPSRLRPLFCRDWSNVSRTYTILCAEDCSALAFCPDALPREMRLCSLSNGRRYALGDDDDGSDDEQQRKRSKRHQNKIDETMIALDPQYLSRFCYLERLVIKGAQMEGEYPFLSNHYFGYLRVLTVISMPQLEFNLDMLSSFPLLEDVTFWTCHQLKGDLSNLAPLKGRLKRVRINNCNNVTGDFMELSYCPQLCQLELNETSVTGDVRNIRVNHFPKLASLSLPERVYGSKIIGNIADANEIMMSLSHLMRRQPSIFRGHQWLLSESSSDYYPSIPSYGAPLAVEYVFEGSRLGWRWTNKGLGTGVGIVDYPDQFGASWVVHCETNWIDGGTNEDGETTFKRIAHHCSGNLCYGIPGAKLIPFKGFYDPPSEEEYHHVIQDTKNRVGKLDLNLLRSQDFLAQLLSQVMPGISDANRNAEEPSYLSSGDGRTGTASTLASAYSESEPDEDSLSDLFDFGIAELHTITDIERQLNIIGTYILANVIDDPKLTWRAMWSMEQLHDDLLGGVRKKHFQRWPRESIPENYPHRDENSDAIYFPGIYASHDAKFAWVGMVMEECAANNKRPPFDNTWGRDYYIPSLDEATSVVSDILFSCAADELSVCLYIDRSMIESFLALATVKKDDSQKRAFQVSSSMTKEEREEMFRVVEESKRNAGLDSVEKLLSSPYIRSDAPIHTRLKSDQEVCDQVAATTLEKFKDWLKGASSGGTLHQEAVIHTLPPRRYDELGRPISNSQLQDNKAENLVLLARIDGIQKDAKTNEVLDDMMTSLGLYRDIVSFRQTSSRNPDIHGYSSITSDLIGGNVHYPDVGGRSSVAFTWSSTQKLTEEHLQNRQRRLAFETEFVRNTKAQEKASKGQLCFLLWPHASNKERGEGGEFQLNEINGSELPPHITEVTSDNTHLIWLPGDYFKLEEYIYNEYLDTCDTSNEIRFYSTYSGNKFWAAAISFLQDIVVQGGNRDSFLGLYSTILNENSLQFCLLLALTRTLIESREFFQDREYPIGDIMEFFVSLSCQWRSTLLESNDVLGLGSGGNLDSGNASREGLYKMLDFYIGKFQVYISDMMDEVDTDAMEELDVDEFEFAPFPPHAHD